MSDNSNHIGDDDNSDIMENSMTTNATSMGNSETVDESMQNNRNIADKSFRLSTEDDALIIDESADMDNVKNIGGDSEVAKMQSSNDGDIIDDTSIHGIDGDNMPSVNSDSHNTTEQCVSTGTSAGLSVLDMETEVAEGLTLLETQDSNNTSVQNLESENIKSVIGADIEATANQLHASERASCHDACKTMKVSQDSSNARMVKEILNAKSIESITGLDLSVKYKSSILEKTVDKDSNANIGDHTSTKSGKVQENRSKQALDDGTGENDGTVNYIDSSSINTEKNEKKTKGNDISANNENNLLCYTTNDKGQSENIWLNSQHDENNGPNKKSNNTNVAVVKDSNRSCPQDDEGNEVNEMVNFENCDELAINANAGQADNSVTRNESSRPIVECNEDLSYATDIETIASDHSSNTNGDISGVDADERVPNFGDNDASNSSNFLADCQAKDASISNFAKNDDNASLPTDDGADENVINVEPIKYEKEPAADNDSALIVVGEDIDNNSVDDTSAVVVVVKDNKEDCQDQTNDQGNEAVKILQGDDEATSGVHSPVKKKRGRPKKIPGAPSVPRKQTQPKKMTSISDPVVKGGKRLRGRPPKSSYREPDENLDDIERLAMQIVQKSFSSKAKMTSSATTKAVGKPHKASKYVDIGSAYSKWMDLTRQQKLTNEELAWLLINTYQAAVVKMSPGKRKCSYRPALLYGSDSDTVEENLEPRLSVAAMPTTIVEAVGDDRSVNSTYDDNDDQLTVSCKRECDNDYLPPPHIFTNTDRKKTTAKEAKAYKKKPRKLKAKLQQKQQQPTSISAVQHPFVKKEEGVEGETEGVEDNGKQRDEKMDRYDDGESDFCPSDDDDDNDSDYKAPIAKKPRKKTAGDTKGRPMPGRLQEHTCEICNKKLRNRKTYNIHVKLHEERDMDTCPICGAQVYLLKSHIRYVHSKSEEKIQCEFCDRTYKHKTSLTQHIKHSHSADSMVYVSCEICGKTVVKSKLTRHKHKKHSAAAKKRVLCQICGKELNNPHNLKVHMRLHTGDLPFVCRYCNKGFRQKWYCIVHERTHTQELPYVCELCGKGFRHITFLNQHKKRHNSDKDLASKYRSPKGRAPRPHRSRKKAPKHVAAATTINAGKDNEGSVPAAVLYGSDLRTVARLPTTQDMMQHVSDVMQHASDVMQRSSDMMPHSSDVPQRSTEVMPPHSSDVPQRASDIAQRLSEGRGVVAHEELPVDENDDGSHSASACDMTRTMLAIGENHAPVPKPPSAPLMDTSMRDDNAAGPLGLSLPLIAHGGVMGHLPLPRHNLNAQQIANAYSSAASDNMYNMYTMDLSMQNRHAATSSAITSPPLPPGSTASSVAGTIWGNSGPHGPPPIQQHMARGTGPSANRDNTGAPSWY